MKTSKIKVSKIDLESFLKEEMQIDPFWNDVIYPQPKKKKIKSLKERIYGKK